MDRRRAAGAAAVPRRLRLVAEQRIRASLHRQPDQRLRDGLGAAGRGREHRGLDLRPYHAARPHPERPPGSLLPGAHRRARLPPLCLSAFAYRRARPQHPGRPADPVAGAQTRRPECAAAARYRHRHRPVAARPALHRSGGDRALASAQPRQRPQDRRGPRPGQSDRRHAPRARPRRRRPAGADPRRRAELQPARHPGRRDRPGERLHRRPGGRRPGGGRAARRARRLGQLAGTGGPSWAGSRWPISTFRPATAPSRCKARCAPAWSLPAPSSG